MKIYRRADGFEVQDAKDRPIEWAVEAYGGEFVEVVPTPVVIDPVELETIQIRKDALEALIDEKIAKTPALTSRLNALSVEEL